MNVKKTPEMPNRGKASIGVRTKNERRPVTAMKGTKTEISILDSLETRITEIIVAIKGRRMSRS